MATSWSSRRHKVTSSGSREPSAKSARNVCLAIVPQRLVVVALVEVEPARDDALDGVLPAGPASRPPCYEEVVRLAAADGQLDRATRAWYTIARREWSGLAGADLQFKAATFKRSNYVRFQSYAEVFRCFTLLAPMGKLRFRTSPVVQNMRCKKRKTEKQYVVPSI